MGWLLYYQASWKETSSKKAAAQVWASRGGHHVREGTCGERAGVTGRGGAGAGVRGRGRVQSGREAGAPLRPGQVPPPPRAHAPPRAQAHERAWGGALALPGRMLSRWCAVERARGVVRRGGWQAGRVGPRGDAWGRGPGDPRQLRQPRC
eukprot:641083-Rhodomonas_salina.1